MEYNKSVSVIIPLYNAEKYFRETIESVLSQDFSDFEIIIIDDRSTDLSSAIAKEYAEKHSFIHYHLQEKNMGAAVARNTGIELAQGRYIAFLDSDDLWAKNKLSRQIDFMRKCGDIAFSYSAYDMINAEGEHIKDKIKIKAKATYKNLLTKTLISTPTVIIDRARTGNLLMPDRRTGQDYAYWLLLLRKFGCAYGIDEALVHVRRRGQSLSKNKFQNLKDVYEVQTINEKIPKICAFFNMLGYMFFTVKKRFL